MMLTFRDCEQQEEDDQHQVGHASKFYHHCFFFRKLCNVSGKRRNETFTAC